MVLHIRLLLMVKFFMFWYLYFAYNLLPRFSSRSGKWHFMHSMLLLNDNSIILSQSKLVLNSSIQSMYERQDVSVSPSIIDIFHVKLIVFIYLCVCNPESECLNSLFCIAASHNVDISFSCASKRWFTKLVVKSECSY